MKRQQVVLLVAQLGPRGRWQGLHRNRNSSSRVRMGRKRGLRRSQQH
jgi:hypothetical protein